MYGKLEYLNLKKWEGEQKMKGVGISRELGTEPDIEKQGNLREQERKEEGQTGKTLEEK